MKIFISACIFLFLSGIFGAYAYFTVEPDLKNKNIEKRERVTSSSATRQEIPYKLIIPKLQINAHVESVGMDKKGNMDIPKDDFNVAWYNLGYQAGEEGNTVLAGHFDTRTGEPAVFYRLEELQSGDTVIVEGRSGYAFTYKVVEVAKYEAELFPLQEVFGPAETNRLNLITCDGIFDADNKNYSHRTVVQAELMTE